MLIQEHPFHVLGITPRSSRREISDRAEALSIRLDPEEINACRLQVTHPAKRIETEVSWFPGVRPTRIQQVVDAIRHDSNLPADVDEKLSGVDCLGKFNALAFWLTAHADVSGPAWTLALHHLAENLQNVDAHELIASLNADRSVADLPQIIDVTAVETAVTRLSQNTAAFLAEHFMRCPRHAQVLTLLVERDTEGGESQASDFISRFVDRYQILVQPMLDRHSERIAADCERVLSIAKQQSAQSARMSAAINELESRISEWGAIAKPIQFLMKSRGLKDSSSIEVAKRVRGVAIDLANDFHLHEQARRITVFMNAVFNEVPELAELLNEDLQTLEGLLDANKEQVRPDDVIDPEPQFCDEKACSDCGRPMVLQEGPSGSSYVCTDHECADPKPINTRSARTNHTTEDRVSDGATSVDGFVQLCQSIRLSCWQRVKANNSPRDGDLTEFKDAYRDFQCHALPWLAIICANHSGDTPPLMKARNAAAECLISLANGLMCRKAFDKAERLSKKALQLILNNDELEMAVVSQLDYIASKKEESAKSTPIPAPNATGPQKSSAPASVAGEASTSAAESRSRSPIQYLVDPRNRLALSLALGIVVLIALPQSSTN